MINWIKRLFKIVKYYDRDKNFCILQANEALKLIRERTRIHADVHLRGDPNNIIIVGQYRGQDYVEIFSIQHDHLSHLISDLRRMEKYGKVSRVDAPAEVSAVVKSKLEY